MLSLLSLSVGFLRALHMLQSFVLETVLCIVNDALYRTSLIMSNHWPVYSWLLSVRTQWQLPFCRIKHGDQVIFATTDLRDIDKGAQGQRLKSMGNLSWELVPHFQCVAHLQVASSPESSHHADSKSSPHPHPQHIIVAAFVNHIRVELSVWCSVFKDLVLTLLSVDLAGRHLG